MFLFVDTSSDAHFVAHNSGCLRKRATLSHATMFDRWVDNINFARTATIDRASHEDLLRCQSIKSRGGFHKFISVCISIEERLPKQNKHQKYRSLYQLIRESEKLIILPFQEKSGAEVWLQWKNFSLLCKSHRSSVTKISRLRAVIKKKKFLCNKENHTLRLTSKAEGSCLNSQLFAEVVTRQEMHHR